LIHRQLERRAHHALAGGENGDNRVVSRVGVGRRLHRERRRRGAGDDRVIAAPLIRRRGCARDVRGERERRSARHRGGAGDRSRTRRRRRDVSASDVARARGDIAGHIGRCRQHIGIRRQEDGVSARIRGRARGRGINIIDRAHASGAAAQERIVDAGVHIALAEQLAAIADIGAVGVARGIEKIAEGVHLRVDDVRHAMRDAGGPTVVMQRDARRRRGRGIVTDQHAVPVHGLRVGVIEFVPRNRDAIRAVADAQRVIRAVEERAVRDEDISRAIDRDAIAAIRVRVAGNVGAGIGDVEAADNNVGRAGPQAEITDQCGPRIETLDGLVRFHVHGRIQIYDTGDRDDRGGIGLRKCAE
jgi:hypothetical protein